MLLEKVISGGQTGVDQAALRAARRAGLTLGGWCPKDRGCEAGRIPDEFPLQETPALTSPRARKVRRSLRTEWNVRDSDATLILRHLDPAGWTSPDPGTAWTATCAVGYARPLLVCDPRDGRSAQRVSDWVESLSIRTLNVAGPSECSAGGIGKEAEDYLYRIFRNQKTPSPRS